MESALAEFFSECDEILQRLSFKLTEKENEESKKKEFIGSLYRDMHTLKGTAQLFGFRLISQIAHVMEASLEPIRRLNLSIPVLLVDELLESVDLIDRILKESNKQKKEVIDTFEEETKYLVIHQVNFILNYFGGELDIFVDKVLFSLDEKNIVNYENFNKLEEKKTKGERENTVLIESKNTSISKIQKVTHSTDPQKVLVDQNANDSSSTIRINVNLLDSLMNLVGEMVLVRNQMLQYGQKHNSLEFQTLNQRLDIVTSDLQGEVMKTRMQPIGSIFSKFQRLVRDLSRDLGKQIELILLGTETELDKTLLEAIKDPLTHIIRNSCDHGIEKNEERVKAGKSPTGHIRITSYHEGGYVIIKISDDGKGLNLQKILEKALEKNIVTHDQSSKLSSHEIAHLIFAPGFSTADSITSVSGRGVGMDVVKTNLEKIGGQVELQFQQGLGMSLDLKIPLTLAIIPALIIRAGGDLFSIPQVKLAELIRVEKDGIGPKIEFLQGRPVFRLRGDLLPLVDLCEILSSNAKINERMKSETINIIILNGDGDDDLFGLIVDEIHDTADIVVKPLSNFLKKLQIYSGATIMGDGSVSLILDVKGLGQNAHLFKNNIRKEMTSEISHSLKVLTDLKQEIQDFLIFKLNSVELYSMPLCVVYRLEEFSNKDIQYSIHQKMVKYRNSILPIISLNQFFCLSSNIETSSSVQSTRDFTSLIVVSKNNRLLGIEVNEVIDIISVQCCIEDSIKETKGILGSLIVEKDVLTVVDVLSIIDEVTDKTENQKSTFLIEKNKLIHGTNEKDSFKKLNILYAEDTVFFMKQVKKFLEKNGHHVTHVSDGEMAWDILSSSKPGTFDLVLSDIEMPKMNGFELAEKVRADSRFEKTPLIALTSKFKENDQEKGLKVGFNRYLEKLREEDLIRSLREVFEGTFNAK